MNAFSIHIPEPCHEDWQQMTPVDKGRFCQSCAKQVVDFSVMTDQEILIYISKASSGNMCGRFTDDQLQRPLHPVKPEKKKVWWVAAAMPLLMLYEKGHAQGKIIARPLPKIQPAQIIMTLGGMQSVPLTPTPLVVYGTVLNSDNVPIPFASITLNGKHDGTSADSIGKFALLKLKKSGDNFLEISAIGYETQKVYITAATNDYNIVLKAVENMLEPVTITGYGTEKRTMTMGTGTVCSAINITARDTLSKIFFPQFKVFPNPARRGTSVNINIKNEGAYSIQLFDNSGKLITVKTFEATEGAARTSIEIPPSLAAGMYYIRLVDEKKKKQYTDKIVVM